MKLKRISKNNHIFWNLLIRVFFTLACMLNVIKMFSQDPSFSQPYANKLFLNPAFAGDSECPSLTLGYRNHLPETGAYNTYILTFESWFDVLNGGLGLIFMNDRQGKGIFNTYSVAASYAYHFQVAGNLFVNAGLETGLIHRNRNSSGLIFPDMLDPFNSNQPSQQIVDDVNKNILDISSGIIASYKRYYLGVAVHHLSQPDVSLSESLEIPLKRKYTIHAGTTVAIGTGRNVHGLIQRGQWSFSPTIIFQHQDISTALSYGLYISRHEFSLGSWLKQDLSFNDFSLTFLAGYSGDSFNFAYSFDFGFSVTGIGMPYSGSHEISFGMKFPCVEKRKKIRAVNCPNF